MSEAFFSYPNQSIGKLLGQKYLRQDSNTPWGSVKESDIYNWWHVALLAPRRQLMLAGYKIETAIFKISNTQSVILDPNTMSLSLSTARSSDPDVSISLESFTNTADRKISIPLGTFELTAENNTKVAFSDNENETKFVYFLGDNGLFSGSRTQSEQSNPEDTYLIRMATIGNLFFDEISQHLYLRWWQSHTNYTRVTESEILEKIPDLNITISDLEDKKFQQLSASNIEAPSGLLWLINPSEWGQNFEQEHGGMFKSAKWIYDRFLESDIDVGGDIIEYATASTNMLISVLPSIKGTDENRVETLFEYIEKLQIDRGIYLPKRIKDGFKYLDYFEIIMVLANYGLIEIPELGEIEVIEDTAPDYEFFLIPEEPQGTNDNLFGNVKKVEIYLKGYGPVTMDLFYPVEDYDMGVIYDAQSSFSWEYIPADPYAEEEEKNKLILVAAPGVHISGDEAGNLPPDCEVIIYRVQSHSDVPEWFTAIDTTLLENEFYMERMPIGVDFTTIDPLEGLDDFASRLTDFITGGFLDLNEESGNVPAFHIKRKPCGIIFTYPAVGIFGPTDNPYKLEIEIDVDPHSANQRFSFDIQKTDWDDPFVKPRNPYMIQEEIFQQFFLIFHYTKGVKFKVKEQNAPHRNSYLNAGNPTSDNMIENTRKYVAQRGWVRYLMYQIDSPLEGQDYQSSSEPLNHLINGIAPQGVPLKFSDKHFYNKYSVDQWVDLHRAGHIEDNIFPSNSSGSYSEAIFDKLDEWRNIDKVNGSLTLTRLDLEIGPNNVAGNTDVIALASLANIEAEVVNGVQYGFITNLTWGEWGQRLFMDIASGFTVAGDVLDVLETIEVFNTRKDRWGQPVSNFGLCLMVAGSMMPLVTNGTLRKFIRGPE